MEDVRFENPTGAPAPIGQYSNVAIVPPGASVAYIAGQLPIDDSGAVVAPGDFGTQACFVFDSLARVLAGSGSSLRDVAFLRTYMVDEADYVRFKLVRQTVFAAHNVTTPPPATTLMVRSLVGGSLIELDAVAVLRASP